MRSIKKVLGLKRPSNSLEENTGLRQESDPTVLDWLNDICPSGGQLLQYLIRFFPFLNWIKHYNAQWLVGDIIAGINPGVDPTTSHLLIRAGTTVGAVVIPQSLGYAKLAGLPVQYGLYTSFMGGVVYWLFATSKDITIGVSLAPK